VLILGLGEIYLGVLCVFIFPSSTTQIRSSLFFELALAKLSLILRDLLLVEPTEEFSLVTTVFNKLLGILLLRICGWVGDKELLC